MSPLRAGRYREFMPTDEDLVDIKRALQTWLEAEKAVSDFLEDAATSRPLTTPEFRNVEELRQAAKRMQNAYANAVERAGFPRPVV